MTTNNIQKAKSRIVYRTRCGNNGCGYSWDIAVTHDDLGALAHKLGCPRCSRRGGHLRTERRLADSSRTVYFQATLIFPALDSLDPFEDGYQTVEGALASVARHA
ncbi:MAG: hypothetical protein VCA74_07355 [Deltaproteobacteria bacterium]